MADFLSSAFNRYRDLPLAMRLSAELRRMKHASNSFSFHDRRCDVIPPDFLRRPRRPLLMATLAAPIGESTKTFHRICVAQTWLFGNVSRRLER